MPSFPGKLESKKLPAARLRIVRISSRELFRKEAN